MNGKIVKVICSQNENILYAGDVPINFDISISVYLIDDELIKSGAIRLLIGMLKSQLLENKTFTLSARKLSKLLGVSEATIYRWRNILLKKGIISKLNKGSYVLNNVYLTYGSPYKAGNISMLYGSIANYSERYRIWEEKEREKMIEEEFKKFFGKE